jgi:hypothetical protein
MFRPDLGSVVHWWAVVRFAVTSSGCYLAWLIVFERWIEPLLRRGGGAIIGRSIVWVSAGGSFRRWGIQDPPHRSTDAIVGLLGSAAVLCAALLPAVPLRLAVTEPSGDVMIVASSYLMTLPMMAVFVLRILWGKRGTH